MSLETAVSLCHSLNIVTINLIPLCYSLDNGPESIRPIFGLKILENIKLFIGLEFHSQYKDITLLCIKTCLKF